MREENMELEWRQVYETGIKKIDEQHKELFQVLKQISDAPIHEKSMVLKDTLQKAIDYSTYHFKEEEEYWEKIHLPKNMIDKHRIEHIKYSKYLNDLLNHFHDGLFLSMTITDFLKEWMIGHVLGEDQEYAKWERENRGE